MIREYYNKQMAVIKVPTSFNIDLEFEVPEFYRRLFALVIDVLIEYFYFRIAMVIFEAILRNQDLLAATRHIICRLWQCCFSCRYCYIMSCLK